MGSYRQLGQRIGGRGGPARCESDEHHGPAVDPGDGGFGAVSVVVNTVGHNLNCSGLGPRLSGGIFDGEHNTVGHKTTGQCVGLVGSSS